MKTPREVYDRLEEVMSPVDVSDRRANKAIAILTVWRDEIIEDAFCGELEYLRWFVINCDFSPADSDVRDSLNKKYKRETEKEVPEIWRSEK